MLNIGVGNFCHFGLQGADIVDCIITLRSNLTRHGIKRDGSKLEQRHDPEYLKGHSGGHLNVKMPSYQYRDPMLKIRQSRDRIIFNMGFPYLGKMVITMRQGPA